MRSRKTVAAAVALLAVAASCGGNGEPAARRTPSFDEPFTDTKAYPVFASSEIVVGENRFLVGLLNQNDAPIGSPETEMSIRFFDLAEGDQEPDAQVDMGFVWIDRPYRGLYQGMVQFDSAGRWGAEITTTGKVEETMRASFQVAESPSTPAVGSKVPESDTPTLDDAPMRELTTDNDPTRRFYKRSVADALDADEPFVLVFATPKFCQSAACAPMLDNVEEVARRFPGVTFIHVEPYELEALPDGFEPVPSVQEWGLPSEPWVFVVDDRGKLAAKYEGVLDPKDLARRLRRL